MRNSSPSQSRKLVPFFVAIAGLAIWPSAGAAQGCGAGQAVPAVSAVSAKSLRVPAKAWQHFEKARRAAEQGKEADFERESAKGFADAPEFAEMYLLRAAHEVAARQYAEAVASVEAAQRVEPGVVWADVLLAGAYNGMGRYADAAAVFTRMHGNERQSWQALHEMARAQVGLQHADGALHWSELALAAAPAGCSNTQLVRANALLVAGRLNEAAEQMRAWLAEGHAGALREAVTASLTHIEQRQREADLQSASADRPCQAGVAAGAAKACTDRAPEMALAPSPPKLASQP